MSSPSAFAEALAAGVVLFDGAMGTEIYRRHVFTNRSFDELCLSDPALIRGIHTDYREAGADVLTTNSFGANRDALAQFALAERCEEINVAAAALARQVADGADRRIFVLGSLGPPPAGPLHADAVECLIVQQARALISGGVDALLFETLPNRQAVDQVAQAMRTIGDVPFVVSVAVVDDGESVSGEPLQRLLAPWAEDGPQPVAWGLNCGAGPDGLLGPLGQAVGLTHLPVIVQPNAGQPKEVGHRKIYLCSPEYLTSYAKRFVALGASGVGGCCGTTPDHIREIGRAVKAVTRAGRTTVVHPPEPEVEPQPPAPFAQRSRWAAKLAAGQWVTSVELLPPRSYDLGPIVQKSKTLAARGVDAVNVPDGPRASSRISPLITCMRIQQQAGLEPILHFCCRDRNLIGMQADLLACAACEIRNILFVTGDPPKLGNYPEATGVFDADSIGMAAVQRRLNQGIDLGGQAIKPPTLAAIGVGLDPTALDRDNELDRFRRKVDAGAEYAITQPVFDTDALLRFLDQVQSHSIPIIAGVWPLASYRNASFLQNEVPGVEVPQAIMDRMASAGGRQEQLAMGVEIARESVDRIRDRIAGIQVSAPFGKIATALAVLESS